MKTAKRLVLSTLLLVIAGAAYGQAHVEIVTGKIAYADYLAAMRAGGQTVAAPAPDAPLPDSVTVTWERTIPRRKSFAPVASRLLAVPDVNRVRPAAAASPSTLIAGLTFDDNATLVGSYSVPPDPHGAAGPSHVCHVVNVAIQCHTTAGVSVLKESLKTFFTTTVTAANDPQTNTFDPKIIYDQFESRWVVITLEFLGRGDAGAGNDESYLFIAVSATSDPTGTWYGQRVDTKVDISGTNYWFDYPGFGVDEDVVYVTGNLFSFPADASNGSRLVVIEKDTASGLYSGSTSTATIYDPATASSATLGSGYQVAHVYGTGPTVGGADFGTFLIGYSGLSSGNTNEFVQYIRVDDPTGTPAFTSGFVAFGNDDDVSTGMANAPQLGSAETIETNDRRTLSAKLRENGSSEWLLWTTFQVMPQSGAEIGETTAHWVALDVTTAIVPALQDDGDIGGEDIASGTYTYFPSVAVDATGDAVFGFSASSSTEYAGAFATAHRTTTAAGSVENTTAVQEGVDDYKRSFGSDRWGDYSSVAVDPNDDFWVTNMVALAGGTSGVGTGDGRWGIYLGEFTSAALPVELVAFDAVTTGGSVRLQWTTASETNNAGFAVEHRAPGEEVWAEAAFVVGAGTTTEGHVYTHTLSDLDPGAYGFRLTQVDYDGKTTFYPAVEVFVELAESFRLSAPAPSPFRDRTTFSLAVSRAQQVRVEVFDVAGRRVALLYDAPVAAHHAQQVTWTPDRLASGVYLVRATGETFTTTRTVLLAQ